MNSEEMIYRLRALHLHIKEEHPVSDVADAHLNIDMTSDDLAAIEHAIQALTQATMTTDHELLGGPILTAGELIRVHRKHRRVSMKALADSVGTSKSYICEIEKGISKNIGLAIAAKICFVLNISIIRLAALAISDTEKAA